MVLPQTAIDHYRQQQGIAVTAAEEVEALWRRMTGEFEFAWSLIAADVLAAVSAAQLTAASTGLDYVAGVVAETGLDAPAVAEVNPRRFVGGTEDGRPVETLIHGAVYEAKSKVAQGAEVRDALAAGGLFLTDAVLDSVRAANRQSVASGMTVRPKISGWVRMLNPPSCKFCITLAGKFYRWNQGFQSHPDCDCRHIPSTEAVARDYTIDPYEYFQGLTEREQNRLFGKNDAQAIRDGADIYRVVNIRSRGLADRVLKQTPGRNRGWQSRMWGTPSEMTIDDIFRAAGSDRDKAVELMEQNGFILGEQTAGGVLKGNSGYGYAGAMGRGGTRKAATRAYQRAVATGERDLLEPATQTAAERRLHQAVLAKQAVKRGRNPFAVDQKRNPLDDEVRSLVDRQYQKEIKKLEDAPQSVRDLARLLGVL